VLTHTSQAWLRNFRLIEERWREIRASLSGI